jgi:hypothetical protein
MNKLWAKFSDLEALPLAIVSILVLCVTGAVAFYVNLKSAEAMNPIASAYTKVQREQWELEKDKREFDAKMAKEEASVAEPKTANLTSFDCSTQEKVASGFASATAQEVAAAKNTSYQFGPGCALVRISTKVTKLEASKYLFYVEDATKSTGFDGCGKQDGEGGRNDSLSDCIKWLNLHRDVRLVLPNSQKVTIN